ncbi:DNA primase [Candidatus Berkelbacteria bacterium RIFCSPLOWO2_01_FULL_50_28]|uniref:DNA primase n=1 Tax=Candidatus Berkelbacteria bacterium RIFCSPLOWO2_01_FULL_50_28 TaxID=1797471 RepID=A0A1F5EAR2_9BACT|nr:MAG: DNA primase [Candidatus Berkelbacteria bacterium RIFCSPHIGHO2_01_FULL_50_36]OGD62819.1 MAG: DNA primase [Candidatus Berkelbacteria bacterium RIFCSPHIGHO2_12_FULL_50_11]OGD64475.1 MAG: DNA primase [Candidatus Berkelbacteria bacterium RIFCSPLOWO2_01_FULL_50_28]
MANEIEDIKQRLDLVELIGSYVQLKKAGANYKAPCPFHQEKTASLMVSPEKQIWKCFGCGKGGDHYRFVMETEHLEFGDALRLLAQKAGVTLQPRTRAEYQTRDNKETLYGLNDFVSRVFHKVLVDNAAGKSALSYLTKRNVSAETIKAWRLGFAPRNLPLRDLVAKRGQAIADLAKIGSPEKFFERIMFPIFDVLGNVVGFTGRAIPSTNRSGQVGESQPKYLNSPETLLFNKSRVLYGLHAAKATIKQRNFVVLVEGQMDVLALHQAGITQAVASSGTAITDTQIDILSKYTPNFLLAFDNDEAGRTTTKKVLEMLLRRDLNGKVIDFGEFKDAGEMFEKTPDAWRQAATSAKESIEWHLDQEIAASGNLSFIENKKKVLKALLPILALVSEATRLDHYTQKLSTVLDLKMESIQIAIGKAKPISTTVPNPANQEEPLTSEEQLLIILMAKPALLLKHFAAFREIVWQSETAHRVAEAITGEYNDKTLVKNSSVQLTSQVKNHAGPDISGKIDSWQMWLTSQWGELDDVTAEDLIGEKIARLSSKQYENRKELLARSIKTSQEAGDIKQVKKLMIELSKLAKEKQG